MTNTWLQYLGVFIASTALCMVLSPVAIVVATRIGALDRPGGHKSHRSPVPYLGGVAIVIAFSGSVAAAAALQPTDFILAVESGRAELIIVLLLAIGLAIVGLADDLRNVSPAIRLMAEVLCAVQLWRMDAGITVSGEQTLDLFLTILWVVGITNAFNLLDNMDGLAAGQAAVCAMTMFAVAAANGQFLVAFLAIGLAGCATGFLRTNFHPARIYMGDGGALYLGFLIAYLGIKLRFESSVLESFLVPVVACAIPVLDTTLVTVSRVRSGRSPFQGGQDHISHRLVKSGLPIPVAVGLTYVATAVIGVLCFVISRVDPISAWILAILVAVTLVSAGILLSLVPVYPESRQRHFVIGERLNGD
ncbi:MAG: undecaprenyl-phosphate alpha-N-acetylglucosaminyl 1-phosphate transferase [Chloroflexi bacterium]|nr:undecaprenyl-phosphate alpha-N-acetylglucosaminyl 1-phosphate transferase [Chloroflexota bacterium]